MRIALCIVFAFLMAALVGAGPPEGQCLAQEKEVPEGSSSEKPIVIHSDTLVFDQQQRMITFEGEVTARSSDLAVDCDKMVVYLNETPSSGSSVESGRIDKIVAVGEVVINRSEGGVARAGKAVFYQGEEKVVLTENPSIQQGPDLAEGHRIVIYLEENRSIIEGSASQRVKATLFPKEEQGK
jgi:lipopolysaccharide export system protein LptA